MYILYCMLFANCSDFAEIFVKVHNSMVDLFSIEISNFPFEYLRDIVTKALRTGAQNKESAVKLCKFGRFYQSHDAVPLRTSIS